ncbi:hypothetical protein B0H13DRAFT_1852503 [Mycena leptocephala]|nr:hypothetical protein B0H13DRAFT_1852503 [Mycena leptocephala]
MVPKRCRTRLKEQGLRAAARKHKQAPSWIVLVRTTSERGAYEERRQRAKGCQRQMLVAAVVAAQEGRRGERGYLRAGEKSSFFLGVIWEKDAARNVGEGCGDCDVEYHVSDGKDPGRPAMELGRGEEGFAVDAGTDCIQRRTSPVSRQKHTRVDATSRAASQMARHHRNFVKKYIVNTAQPLLYFPDSNTLMPFSVHRIDDTEDGMYSSLSWRIPNLHGPVSDRAEVYRKYQPPVQHFSTGTPPRLKFTGFFGSQDSDSKSEEPASKKRKAADDRAAEEAAENKGEGSSTGRSRRH